MTQHVKRQSQQAQAITLLDAVARSEGLKVGKQTTTQRVLKRIREAYLRDVVRGAFPNLAYDEAAATWHGEERARLESLGHTPPFVDGQIAAIAKVHGLTVVTTNDKDFSGFKGLAVENWSKESTRPRAQRTLRARPGGWREV